MADPLLPIVPHKDIDSTYVKIKPSDMVIVNFETSRVNTISSISGTVNKGSLDHNIVAAPNDSVCAFTASYSGTNSALPAAICKSKKVEKRTPRRIATLKR